MSDSLFEMQFPAVARRSVECRFDGGEITSDAGLLMLSSADRKLRLSERLAEQIVDTREAGKVRHEVADLLRERIFAIAAGYEDANDLDDLCRDPALLLCCGKLLGQTLASQPTLSRFENAVEPKDLFCLAETLAWIVVGQLPADTRSVVLDVDASDDPCHGQQELEFFNGYYDTHCYLPLYLHVTGDDGVQRLMASLLRPGNAGAKLGLFGMLRTAMRLLRKRFPAAAITLRADSAFGDGEVLDFCDKHGLAYTLALKGNKRLERVTAWIAEQVFADCKTLGTDQKEFISFTYQAESWERARRVVAKVETVNGKLNVRYVLTSRPSQKPERVYQYYCERGDRENRIKEMKVDLVAGRTSCHRFWANQFRLILHAAACVLWRALQDALTGTCWANKQIGTLRLMLVKIGARVVQSCRRIWLHLPTSCPHQGLWRYLHGRLLSQPT
jgi:Transposase DDE domain.